MSGHSKWAKIKHKKESADAQKGKLFSRLAKEIILAVKEGGSGDPKLNFTLRAIAEKAKQANMPNANIQRAIKVGLGEEKGDTVERLIYEAYGPFGVALVILVITDNKNRTVSNLKSILNNRNGRLAEDGSVLWQFDKKGRILMSGYKIVPSNKFGQVPQKVKISFDEVFEIVTEIDGVEDLKEINNQYELICEYSKLGNVREEVFKKQLDIIGSGVWFIPQNLVSINDEQKEKLIDLVQTLKEDEDVNSLWINCKL